MRNKIKIHLRLSKSFQVAGLFSILLVILIHYNSKDVVHVRDADQLVKEFLTGGIARIAVPYFALSSGFFLFYSYEQVGSYLLFLKKKISTLFVPYLLGSFFIFIPTAIFGKKYHFSFFNVVNDVIIHPLAGQYWFLRDLIVITILSPIIIYLKRIKLFLFIISLLWLFDIQPFPLVSRWYLINIETIFFVMLGCFLSGHFEIFDCLVNASKKYICIIGFIWFVLIAIRVYVDPTFNNWYRHDYTLFSLLVHKTSILIGLSFLISFSSRRIFDNRIMLTFSSFTFFVYLFHTEPLRDVIIFIVSNIVEKKYIFYISFPVAVIVFFLSAYFLQKYFPAVYGLMTGNRDTKKVLSRN